MPIPAAVPIIASGLSAVGDFLSGNENRDRQNRLNQAYLALEQARAQQQNRQFGITHAEDARQFDATQGLNQQKFGAQQEQEQYGRKNTARYAAVRAPLIQGLGSGQLLKDNPNWQKYAPVGR